VIILIDGNIVYPDDLYRIIPVTKGDNIHWTIALASIYAKVTRDTWMYQQAPQYPEYQFERHKGYGTQIHQEAIRTHGLSPLHRKSFCTKILV
jgi:ribonuclease HII